MHIAYCIPTIHYASGVERIVIAKANYLAREYGYQVSFITSCMHGRKPAFPLAESIKVYDLDVDYTAVIGNPIKKIHKKLKLRKLHRKRMESLLMALKPDITISTFMEEATFLPDIKDGSKKLLELHFSRGLKSKFLAIKKNNYPFSVVLSSCWHHFTSKYCVMPRFDKFVSLTEQDLISWGGASDKRCFIHNMLPWQPSKTSTLKHKRVIAAGRLDKMKGFDRLIDIWASIDKRHPDWTLDIFGEGSEHEYLKQLIGKYNLNDKVILRGHSEDMEKEYLSSSIMVMTSHSEGMPMCLLEAKAYGLPIVSYDIHCGPKDIINHGKDGYLVTDGDKESFCHYLDLLISDDNLRSEMGKAQLSDSTRFEQKAIMAKWKNIFEEMTGKPSTHIANSHTPLLSIIIPIYNLPIELIKECLHSVMSISLADNEREVIVIDDGSKENFYDDIKGFHDKIKFFRTENQGLGPARNLGLSHATGKYIQFLDGDDMLIKKNYDSCIDYVRKNEVDILMFDMTTKYKESALASFNISSPTKYMLNNNLHGAACGYIFKREILGNLQFNNIICEDEEFTPQLVLQARTLVNTKTKAYFYRQRSGSIINNADPHRQDKRFSDILGVIVRLHDLTKILEPEKQAALNRRVAQLTMDYIYNIWQRYGTITEVKRRVEELRVLNLYPLTTKYYTLKYTTFRLFVKTIL